MKISDFDCQSFFFWLGDDKRSKRKSIRFKSIQNHIYLWEKFKFTQDSVLCEKKMRENRGDKSQTEKHLTYQCTCTHNPGTDLPRVDMIYWSIIILPTFVRFLCFSHTSCWFHLLGCIYKSDNLTLIVVMHANDMEIISTSRLMFVFALSAVINIFDLFIALPMFKANASIYKNQIFELVSNRTGSICIPAKPYYKMLNWAFEVNLMFEFTWMHSRMSVCNCFFSNCEWVCNDFFTTTKRLRCLLPCSDFRSSKANTM